ncbi:MAG: hypothetical protein ABIT36_03330 [Steroidobacteraceae bacterium]
MSLAELVVLHRRRIAGELAPSEAVAAGPDTCAIDTCLRQVRIGTRALLGTAPVGMGTRQGVDAYRFLLALACGLESEIAGETEILGQIKAGWREFDTRGSLSARRLRPIMQRLFQDTKEIRSHYLTSLGSASYGTLVRKLLGGRVDGPTLLIGAGQLAATVLPYLDGAQLTVWNRSATRLNELIANARNDKLEAKLLDSSEAAELVAWGNARNVIVCIPADAQRDAARVAAWSERSVHAGRVLHLGIESAKNTAWDGVTGLATLGDLFSMRDAQAAQRNAQLARARCGCAEKAQLALLESNGSAGHQGSSQHGWDDLGAFQALGY